MIIYVDVVRVETILFIRFGSLTSDSGLSLTFLWVLPFGSIVILISLFSMIPPLSIWLRILCNARMGSKQLQAFCHADTAGQELLKQVTDRLGLSARTYTRLLKVARTIADLAGSEDIAVNHLAEAIQCRSLDRQTTAVG
jgi:hypothetical protein